MRPTYVLSGYRGVCLFVRGCMRHQITIRSPPILFYSIRLYFFDLTAAEAAVRQVDADCSNEGGRREI